MGEGGKNTAIEGKWREQSAQVRTHEASGPGQQQHKSSGHQHTQRYFPLRRILYRGRLDARKELHGEDESSDHAYEGQQQGKGELPQEKCEREKQAPACQ